MTKKDKGLIKLIIILALIIFIPFGIFVWYSQPIDETLTCDKDYKCKVETIRFFNIKMTKEFGINNLNELTIKYSYQPTGSKGLHILVPTGHRYFVQINGNSIFNYPICSVSEYNDNYEVVCKPFTDSVNLNFEKYKQNLIQDFVLTSEAKIKNKFWFCIILDLLLWFLLIGTLFIDSDFCKEYKRIRKQERNKQRKNKG